MAQSVLAVFFLYVRLLSAFLIDGRHSLQHSSSNNVLDKDRRTGKVWINDVPEYFDWRVTGGVSPVKDQGQCGACWAFSAVANSESQWKIHRSAEYSLSEQFLIDCNHMGAACSGASIIKTFSDIITNIGGVLQVNNYPPFENKQGECRWNGGSSQLVPVIGFSRVKPDEELMKQHLYNVGPLSAAINSDSMKKYFQNTTIDEPTEAECPSAQEHLDHSILIVGYNVYIGKDGSEVPYWIIKNSWGTDWGDQGFYYLARGRGSCGINSDVSYAIVP